MLNIMLVFMNDTWTLAPFSIALGYYYDNILAGLI